VTFELSPKILGFEGTASPNLGTVLLAIGSNDFNGFSWPIDVLVIQEVQTQATMTQNVVNQLNLIYGTGKYAREFQRNIKLWR